MSLFTNPEDGRPRAGWRLIIQFILMLILLTGWQLFAQGILDNWQGHGNLAIIISGVFVVLSIWLAAYLMDLRKLSEYGLRINSQWWRELSAGIIFGVLGMGAIFMFYRSAGWVEFTGWGWDRSHAYPFIVVFGGHFLAMASVGFYEELLARGYQTKNLAEGLRFRFSNCEAAMIAVAITSLIFGALHIGNPHTTWLSTLNITIAGIMLGVPYILTNSLALPIGLHFSWNFFQGGIFGFSVSGRSVQESIIQASVDGPELITGGRFGPEGGLAGTIVIIGLIILILIYYNKQKDIQVDETFTNPPEILQVPGNKTNK